MIEKFLKELQVEMELDTPFPKKAPGTWAIPLEDNLVVTLIEMEPEGLDLRCPVGPYPSENEADIIDKMLIDNLFGQGTGDAVLGMDEEGKQIVLARTVLRRIDYQEFKDILEDFLNTAEIWHEELTNPKKET